MVARINALSTWDRSRIESPDEYPYACTYEGGFGASVARVPVSEQNLQGGQLSILYSLLNDKDAFIVVPMPDGDYDLAPVLQELKTTETKRMYAERMITGIFTGWRFSLSSPLGFPIYTGPGGLNESTLKGY